MKGSGLTVEFTELGNPIFEEGRLVLECKKLYGAPFDPNGFGDVAKKEYSNRPLHSVYIGEIVNAWIKEQETTDVNHQNNEESICNTIV